MRLGFRRFSLVDEQLLGLADGVESGHVGLVETRQGVGVFVLRTTPQPRPIDVLAELRMARAALARAIEGIERPSD